MSLPALISKLGHELMYSFGAHQVQYSQTVSSRIAKIRYGFPFNSRIRVHYFVYIARKDLLKFLLLGQINCAKYS